MDNYLEGLEKIYLKHADREKALPMKQYMKNHFEFFGIDSAQRRAIEKAYLKEFGKPPLKQLLSLIKEAYAKPQREFQYFIIELTAGYVKEFPADFIKTTRFMLVNKSWWDSVDAIAAWIAGGLVKKYPELAGVMDEWIEDENMWLQRTAILHQLKFKKLTDEKRLFEYCRKCASSKEFFIRKAIGWALREYSKVNPSAVKKFVAGAPISPFSKKEAMKWIEKMKSRKKISA